MNTENTNIIAINRPTIAVGDAPATKSEILKTFGITCDRPLKNQTAVIRLKDQPSGVHSRIVFVTADHERWSNHFADGIMECTPKNEADIDSDIVNNFQRNRDCHTDYYFVGDGEKNQKYTFAGGFKFDPDTTLARRKPCFKMVEDSVVVTPATAWAAHNGYGTGKLVWNDPVTGEKIEYAE